MERIERKKEKRSQPLCEGSAVMLIICRCFVWAPTFFAYASSKVENSNRIERICLSVIVRACMDSNRSIKEEKLRWECGRVFVYVLNVGRREMEQIVWPEHFERKFDGGRKRRQKKKQSYRSISHFYVHQCVLYNQNGFRSTHELLTVSFTSFGFHCTYSYKRKWSKGTYQALTQS